MTSGSDWRPAAVPFRASSKRDGGLRAALKATFYSSDARSSRSAAVRKGWLSRKRAAARGGFANIFGEHLAKGNRK